MSQHKINDLIFRIRRLFKSIKDPVGEGILELENDGRYEVTKFNGCKSPQEQLEQIERLALYIWNLKDHLKERLIALGGNPKEVEDYVDACQYLPLCSDLANGSKHAVLEWSRSGRYAYIPEGETKISNRTGFRTSRGPTEENTLLVIADDPET